ncbi:MAG: toll/interleukin-1 receptor domain-containing protein [Proteobacteria bacterium]|nr:toll/interleukin-1 receptor domain-containing protein [Pseudomonadota bacterium]
MADNAVGEGTRYWAFISYSHKDASFGRRLHRRLEAYALPRRLVGRTAAQGIVPKRLTPIFRDREELPAANDLTAEVRAALKASRSLIVVCSRAAAASMWVSREVEVFRELHPTRPVLAALVDGEPRDAFPTALRQPGQSGASIEPLAADFRKTGDGESLGLLKLIAGMLSIGLDELIQRDAQRRLQRVTAVTATALAAMVVMGLLTLFALDARREAERQRGEAEGLVEFMLTDLRTKLEGVGRLDVMTAVNQRALSYYSDQDLKTLPADSLERRARILHVMGADDETRGDEKAALEKFQEARRTTAALLAQAPNDPDRIFDHAQSEFWIGYANYMQARYVEAETSFLSYKRLADQLDSIAPNDPRSTREVGYAGGNLCSNALKQPKQKSKAIELCSIALEDMEKAARTSKNPNNFAKDLANRHSWLVTAYLANGDREHAVSHLQIEDHILNDLIQSDPKNMINRTLWVSFQRQIAWTEAQIGRKDQAKARLLRASKTLDDMIRFEPRSETWRRLQVKIGNDLKEIAAHSSKGDDND